MSCRVLIVDDDDLFAELLKALLAGDGRFEVIGRARNGIEALELVPELDPDVVTMDIEMPVLNGVEATRRLVALDADRRIVIVSSSVVAEPAARSRWAGAAGYVTKSRAADELPEVLLAVCRGAAFAERA